MITRDELQALLRESMKSSPADETELVANINSTSLTRFAKSSIHPCRASPRAASISGVFGDLTPTRSVNQSTAGF